MKKEYTYKKLYPDGIGQRFWREFVVPTIRKLKENKCEICGTTKRKLFLHHTDYIEEVSINTLKLVCQKCHINNYHKK